MTWTVQLRIPSTRRIRIRYYNRGLCYAKIGDIRSACADWHRSGTWGLDYINQYCNEPFDSVIHESPDTTIQLKLKIRKPEAAVLSIHTPSTMTECEARLTISNVSHDTLTFLNTDPGFGPENSKYPFYLEAVNAEGIKFRFLTSGDYLYYGSEKQKVLLKGNSYTKEINITQMYQFCYAGEYRVRLVMRPSSTITGLSKTYYSNWVTLMVKESK